jgi:hypothetical protein
MCGVCDFGCPTELVHIVGVSIPFEKNFYRLPFTPPPLSGRLVGPSASALVAADRRGLPLIPGTTPRPSWTRT